MPAIPPGRDATSTVELFSTLARVASASRFASGGRAAPGSLCRHGQLVLQQLLEERRTRFTTMPPQPSLSGLLSLAQAQTGSPAARLRLPSSVCPPRLPGGLRDVERAILRGCCQAWLLEQTERTSHAAESGDLRPVWSLVRALDSKRRRLVPRPVLDDGDNPAPEPSRVAERTHGWALLYTEFGHRVKIGSPSFLHGGGQPTFKKFLSPSSANSRWGGDRSRLGPQRDPPWGRPELHRIFC